MTTAYRAGALAGVALLAVATLSWPAAAGSPPDDDARPRDEGSAAELGRRLFFDPAVGRTGRRSCASCHDPDHGYSVPEPYSLDDMGPTRRRSSPLVDVHAAPSLHGDGEFSSVEDLVRARIGFVRPRSQNRYHTTFASAVLGPEGHGGILGLPDPDDAERPFGSHPLDLNLLPDVGRTLEAAGRYADAFTLAFGTPRVTTERIATAVAAYVATLRSGEAPIDRHLAGDASALDASARRGLDLFRGRAGCVACHRMGPGRPTFTDQEFHDTGVAWKTIQAATPPGSRPFDADRVEGADAGRAGVTTASPDRRAFRTPTLRDVARHGPFMHDGTLATLEDVVRHYAGGGAGADDRQDPRIRGFSASEDDVADLVAFLHALTSDRRPGLPVVAWGVRAPRARLRLVDANREPLAGWRVGLVPEGDLVPGREEATRSIEVETDELGRFEAPASPRTHWRLVLPDGLEPRGGPLVPDTCARADLVVPVAGRARVLVALAPGAPAPSLVEALHEGAMRLPGDPVPRTVLRLAGRSAERGVEHAVYEGWARVDLPDRVAVVLPADGPGLGRPARLAAGPAHDVGRARPRPLATVGSVGEARETDPRVRPRGEAPRDDVRPSRLGGGGAVGPEGSEGYAPGGAAGSGGVPGLGSGGYPPD
jgi:cytochrome c peroxidase